MKEFIKNMSKEDIILLNLKKLYDSYGYKKITLPTFDEYDLYNENKDFISGNILTIMNPSGKLLALRPDITLSFAKKMSKEQPLKYSKVYYNENVYRTRKHTGYKEIEQLGIELIGKDSLSLNYEIINLAIESLKTISKNSMIVLSHATFVPTIFESLNLDHELQSEIFKYIEDKNKHDIERILEKVNIDEASKKLICLLPTLAGKLDSIFEKLADIKINDKLKKILDELKELEKLLAKFHSTYDIIYDFSIVKNLNYYNGITLQGYIEGLPSLILTGGRYDKLFEKLGINTGAIGFAILTDDLKDYFKNIKNLDARKDFDILLLHDHNNYEKLFEIVENFISKAYRVRAEFIENENDIDAVFNYEKKYFFENGELKEA